MDHTTSQSTAKDASALRSILLGLPIPILFALYSIALVALKPVDASDGALSTVQMCWLATTLTSLAGGAITLVSTTSSQQLVYWLKRDWIDLSLLNVCTLFGPPLYIFAVVRLGASPANWIGLGMTPIMTFVAALLHDKERRSNPFTYVGLALTTAGLLVVMASLAHKGGAGRLIGAAASVLSALGTASGGIFITRLQRKQNSISDGFLLCVRFVLASITLALMWAMLAHESMTPLLAVRFPPMLFILLLLVLYVLPSYAYVLIVRRSGLLFSGYMWALIPVFASLVELVLGESALSWRTTFTVGTLVVSGTLLSEMTGTRLAPRG